MAVVSSIIFRDCLDDVFNLAYFEQVLAGKQTSWCESWKVVDYLEVKLVLFTCLEDLLLTPVVVCIPVEELDRAEELALGNE